MNSSNARQHALFQQFPLNGKATISTGEVPTPYHIYDGYGAFIAGTADLAATQRLLQSEQVTPLQNTDGRALMGIWLCDFVDASLGPHHELQFSIFVTRQKTPALSNHPLSLLSAMLTQPDLQMMCHGLWNSTAVVVAYNRELLSLNAKLSTSTIERDAQKLQFDVRDAASGSAILTGHLSKPAQLSWSANWAFLRQLGFGKTMQANRQPWIEMQVVNPLGVRLTHNGVAKAMDKNDTNNIRYFDPQSDRLTFGNSPYCALDFRPQVVQHMSGFKFVYLEPQ